MTPSPTERFSHLAAAYARHRPTYPAAAISWIVRKAGLAPGELIADLGAGTGISTRLLAERGLRVVGIEPNEPMRRLADETPWPGPGPAPRFLDGTGEATGLPDASCDAVVAAQAFHWFDPAKALAEAERILKPGGWLFLMWNEREEADPFTKAYGEILQQYGETALVEAKRYRAGDVLLTWPCFADAERATFQHEQALDETGLLGRAASVSYGPKTDPEKEKLYGQLRALFAQWSADGMVRMKYVTTITAARKP